jgi:uroporphyrinogen-III decarboxylase
MPKSMTHRERVFAALNHEQPDRVPCFEVWIDALIDELGNGDPVKTYVNTGQDCIMMPTIVPDGTNAWKSGVDEWGRTWQGGTYVSGVVKNETDLEKYSPPLEHIDQYFDPPHIESVREAYPDHCLIYGTHIGPFMAGYMAMGIDRFFYCLIDSPGFVHQLLSARTDWCIAMYQKALALGAEVLVLGDDAAYASGPMIAPAMWREFVLPYHRRIVEALDAPILWHSDGDTKALLPMAIDAGFVGVHGLEPAAGMDLGTIEEKFGRNLVLVGNLDVQVLFNDNLVPVRREVDRCLAQGSQQGGYMFSSCNSIFVGMKDAAVAEMYKYLGSVAMTR